MNQQTPMTTDTMRHGFGNNDLGRLDKVSNPPILTLLLNNWSWDKSPWT